MKMKHFLASFVMLFAVNQGFTQAKSFKIQTIAFYNVENLFDTINDPKINDEEYLPVKGWTYKNYKKKLDNLSRVLPEIGTGENQKNAPVVIGVCEVENRYVLEDLVKHPKMLPHGYSVIHFDSPDKRGIDVGFLYQSKYFTPVSYTNIPLYIYRDMVETTSAKPNKKEKEEEVDTDDVIETNIQSKRVYTRDQLLVSGYLDGEEIHFIVNHWPSRSGGEKKSSPYREAAGRLNRQIIDSLYKINPDAKIITMGDLNDGPFNNSVKKEIGTKGRKEDVKAFGMYNPMEEMSKKGIGSLAYRDAWDLFDQMFLSEPFVRKEATGWMYWKAGVYNKPFLIQKEGPWKGYPLRNSNGVPGFSDHFPVYVHLIKEVR
jgi:hypothetical protein